MKHLFLGLRGVLVEMPRTRRDIDDTPAFFEEREEGITHLHCACEQRQLLHMNPPWAETHISSAIVIGLHRLSYICLVVDVFISLILDIQTSIVDEYVDTGTLLLLDSSSKGLYRLWIDDIELDGMKYVGRLGRGKVIAGP